MLKQPRIVDKKYRASFRDAVCISCGSTYGVVGAHIRAGHEGGMGLKPSDDLILPLCYECHSKSHNIGEVRFWREQLQANDALILDLLKATARARYVAWRERTG